jgi:hypothetical protein
MKYSLIFFPGGCYQDALIKVIATMASLGKFSKMGFAYGMALCLL